MPLSTSDDRVPWRDIMERRYAASVVLVCLGVWLHAADSLIVATMMPAIVAEIGGEKFVAWNFALYQIGSIVAGSAAGLIALRRGIRGPMAISASVFALGCLLSALAPTMVLLLAGRLAQGIGGGGLVSLAFVAVTRLFPKRLIPRVIAAMSAIWGGSAFLGPLVGGVFVTYASWRAGFVFFALQALVLALWIGFGLRQHETRAEPQSVGRIPIMRLGLLSLAVLCVAYAGITTTALAMVAALAAGLGMLALFLHRDGRSAANRLWPRGCFDIRNPVGAALLMVLAMNIATTGISTYGPLLMVLIHQTPVIVAGYAVAGISIAWTIAAILVSGLPERHDRMLIGIGMILTFLSVAGSIYAVPAGPVALIAGVAALEGVGFGMAWTFILRRATRLSPPDDVGRLAAALPTVQRLGFALGAAMTGIFANSAGFDGEISVEHASHVARMIFLGSVPIAALGLVSTIFFLRGVR